MTSVVVTRRYYRYMYLSAQSWQDKRKGAISDLRAKHKQDCAMERPSHVRLTFGEPGGANPSARVKLLWDAAPKTVAAILSLCDESGRFAVSALHARHSGAEALFLTPSILRDVGDENATLPVQKGDVLFGYEPTHICNHATEDASEVAWIYHDACTPSRWVSADGDPTNQRPPFKRVEVALNLWGKIEGDADAFYTTSGALPRQGEQPMTITIDGDA